jgi:D-cysteine desulfhydrase/L-cysteate sulfo-lyase
MGQNMTIFNDIPRVVIGHGPTPIESAPRLSAKLGCNVLIKRDDCTGLAGGGNKTRKLEYLLADAQSQGADTLITIGGLQSNHARQTAAAAAKFGFQCELILESVKGTPKEDYGDNGNILLSSLLGANIHRLSVDADCDEYAQQLIEQLIADGKKPYLVPVGGSNVIGSLGYVRCAYELAEQVKQGALKIDQIVIASGSAGTQAGLLAGLIASDLDIPVLGINVSRASAEQTQLVTKLLKQVLLHLGLDPQCADNKVFTNGDYVGEGYGIATQGAIDAIKDCASLEGILLDPVYTGKAMAGLIDLTNTAEIAADSHQLFLHTGGSQGLFAYKQLFV